MHGLTWSELVFAIDRMCMKDRQQPAKVYPPETCPATVAVPVLSIGRTADGTPVLLTGKTPA